MRTGRESAPFLFAWRQLSARHGGPPPPVRTRRGIVSPAPSRATPRRAPRPDSDPSHGCIPAPPSRPAPAGSCRGIVASCLPSPLCDAARPRAIDPGTEPVPTIPARRPRSQRRMPDASAPRLAAFCRGIPCRSRYQPRSKGLNSLLRCNSRSWYACATPRRRKRDLPRPRQLHLPTAFFDRARGGPVP